MSELRNRKNKKESSSTEEKKPFQNDDNSISFCFFDIIRMISGLLLLNLFLSYWFTGTFTYNYSGKLIDPHYLYFQAFGSYVNLTDSELAKYDGSIEGLPIYIGVNGTVFDVSSKKEIYGPDGSYYYLSGKDCARAYATNCLNQQTYDIRDLEPEEIRRLKGWHEFFETKYFKVGVVNHEPLTGPTPDREDCRGRGH